MRISAALANDAVRLSTFAAREFINAYGGENPPPNVMEYVAASFNEDALRKDINDARNLYLLGSTGDAPEDLLGYVKLQKNRPIPELDDAAPAQLERIYVDHSRHGHGVGKTLLGAAEDAAVSFDARAIWLSVWDRNERAQRFYERHGFVRVGKTHFMIGDERQEDLILAKELA